jgi:hypothetical protein
MTYHLRIELHLGTAYAKLDECPNGNMPFTEFRQTLFMVW